MELSALRPGVEEKGDGGGNARREEDEADEIQRETDCGSG